MRIRLGVCLAVLAALAFAPGGGAASEARTVLLGAFGDYERFDSMTGQRTRVGHVIMSWGQATGPRLDRMLAGMREIPMLGIGTNRGHPITPLAIARSEGDAFLVDLNRAVAAFPGERIYIRPFGEMNGHWNDYSAQAYYPGALFVDVVGNDLYNIRFKAEWAANEALYRAHPKKPYAIPSGATGASTTPAS